MEMHVQTQMHTLLLWNIIPKKRKSDHHKMSELKPHRNTRLGKSRFTVVHMRNRVYSCNIISHRIIFHRTTAGLLLPRPVLKGGHFKLGRQAVQSAHSHSDAVGEWGIY